MKRAIITLTIVCVFLLSAANAFQVSERNPFLLTNNFAAEINQKTNGLWTASTESSKFGQMTKEEIKKFMGVRDISNQGVQKRVFSEEEMDEEIPEEFDSGANWPQCHSIREIRDQSNCGSCWAIAAAAAITDRYCVVGNNTEVRISTADLLSCCFVCGFGCNGGIPTIAWTWWVWVGLTTEQCQPYPFAPCGHHTNESKYPACPSTLFDTPTCNFTCTNSSEEMIKMRGASSYGVSGEEAYQRELMANGPFEVAFTVYEDFVAYKTGIYTHVSGDSLGGHAVKLVGWGVENGVKYWKIANSWNEEWGEKGHFRILRGVNECGIEDSGVAGLPAKEE